MQHLPKISITKLIEVMQHLPKISIAKLIEVMQHLPKISTKLIEVMQHLPKISNSVHVVRWGNFDCFEKRFGVRLRAWCVDFTPDALA